MTSICAEGKHDMEGIDFVDRIKETAARLRERVPHCKTEEATKMSLVIPFLEKVLGWDTDDPHQLVPEYVADIGTKRGEKVDYAIMVDDEPAILIEAKKVGTALGREPMNQLYRYFGCTPAHFAILTDGINYLFFADLDDENRMDPHPFFTINLREIDAGSVAPLRAFSRAGFDVERTLELARDLRCIGEIGNLLSKLWAKPSDSFIKWIIGELHDGPRTKPVKERYQRTCKAALDAFLARGSDLGAKGPDDALSQPQPKATQPPESAPQPKAAPPPQPGPARRGTRKGVPTTVTIGNWTETFKSCRSAVLESWKRLDAVRPGFMQRWADSPQGQGRSGPVVSMDSNAAPRNSGPLECASGTWHVRARGSREEFTYCLRLSCEANGLVLGRDVILADADDA